MIENFIQFMNTPDKEEQLETFCPLDDLEADYIPLWVLLLGIAVLGLTTWFLFYLISVHACS